VRNRGESASSGTGTRISTLLAVLRRLNCAFACIEETNVISYAYPPVEKGREKLGLKGGVLFDARAPFAYLQHVLNSRP
jgi:hypothetical protein